MVGCRPNPESAAANLTNSAVVEGLPANDAVAEAAAASAANDAASAGGLPQSREAVVDLFKVASPDRWTPLSNPWNTLVAVARLSPSRDAALVSWQEGGQMWCGTSVPDNECKGGRFLELVATAAALPGAAKLKADYPAVIVAANGVAARGLASNLGTGLELNNDVAQAPLPGLHMFLLTVDYASEPGVQRQLQHCREIQVTLLGRTLDFKCKGLPTDNP